MSQWQIDKSWSERFLPEIKQILGLCLIGKPEESEDILRNTDLIVLKMEAVRIACRIRRFKYLENYRGQFTIRSRRPGGQETELSKIIAGWGDYFFYGFSNQEENALAFWFLADLNVFRLWFNRQLVCRCGKVPGFQQQNHDGSSDFIAFSLSEMPANFMLPVTLAEERQPSKPVVI